MNEVGETQRDRRASHSCVGLACITDPQGVWTDAQAIFEDVFLQAGQKDFHLCDVLLTRNEIVFIPRALYEHDFDAERASWKAAGVIAAGGLGWVAGNLISRFAINISRHIMDTANTGATVAAAGKQRDEERQLPFDTVALLHARGFLVPKYLITAWELSGQCASMQVALESQAIARDTLLDEIPKIEDGDSCITLTLFFTGTASRETIVSKWLETGELPTGRRGLFEYRDGSSWPSPRKYLESFLNTSGTECIDIGGYAKQPLYVKQLAKTMLHYATDRRLVEILKGMRSHDPQFFQDLYNAIGPYRVEYSRANLLGNVIITIGWLCAFFVGWVVLYLTQEDQSVWDVVLALAAGSVVAVLTFVLGVWYSCWHIHDISLKVITDALGDDLCRCLQPSFLAARSWATNSDGGHLGSASMKGETSSPL